MKIFFLQNYFSFIEQVFIPKGTYNGQKLIKLVRVKITAITNNTIPNVPEMFPIKYKTTIIAATIKRNSLSTLPIFFFIINSCKIKSYTKDKF